jgi:hypothetical protein
MIAYPNYPTTPVDPLAKPDVLHPGDHLLVPSLPTDVVMREVRFYGQKLSPEVADADIPIESRDAVAKAFSGETAITRNIQGAHDLMAEVQKRMDLSDIGRQALIVQKIDAVRKVVDAIPAERLTDAHDVVALLERPPKRTGNDVVTELREREIRDAFRARQREGRFGVIKAAIDALEHNAHDVGAREFLNALVASPHIIRAELFPGDPAETLRAMRTALDPERARAIAWAGFAIKVMEANVKSALNWLDTKRSAFNAPTHRSNVATV